MIRLPARWDELAWPDVAGLDPEQVVALLPVGAIEQHGPHLPLATDALIADALARAALDRAPRGSGLLVLPTLAVGKSDEHLAYPGTLTLSGETLARLWSEIGASIARAGVRKLLILNAHGGQIGAAQGVARALRISHRMLVATVLWPQLGLPDGLFAPDELRFGIHGGDLETSVLMALRPDLVRLDRLARREPATQRRAAAAPILSGLGAAGFGWMAQDLHPEGAAGDAAAATAEKGRLVLEQVAARILALLEELRVVPLSSLADGPLDRS